MGTVAAIESTDGVAIAADTRVTEGETIQSEGVHRLFEFDSVAAGVSGATNGIQAFGRRLETELREREHEGDGETGIETFARIGARQAQRAGVDAVLAARDDEGIARIREVGADGRVLEGRTVALGSGAEIAIARLDSHEPDIGVEEAADAVRDAIRAAMERDGDTGGTIDVWTLANSDSDAAAE